MAISPGSPEESPQTWGEAVDLYLAWVKGHKGNVRYAFTKRAIDDLLTYMRLYVIEGRISFKDDRIWHYDTYRMLEGFHAWLKDTGRYNLRGVFRLVVEMKAFFKWLHDNGHIHSNPAASVTVAKYEKGPGVEPITEEVFEALKAKTKGVMFPAYLMILLGWYTGMSTLDCHELKWEDVDWDNMAITKVRIKMRARTSKKFSVPILVGGELHQALLVAMGCRTPGGPYVLDMNGSLTNPNQRNWTTSQVTLMLKNMKLGMSFGGFRHSFISRLANSHVNWAVAASMTGHDNPQVFAGYVKVKPESAREALAIAFSGSDPTVPRPVNVVRLSQGQTLDSTPSIIAKQEHTE